MVCSSVLSSKTLSFRKRSMRCRVDGNEPFDRLEELPPVRLERGEDLGRGLGEQESAAVGQRVTQLLERVLGAPRDLPDRVESVPGDEELAPELKVLGQLLGL